MTHFVGGLCEPDDPRGACAHPPGATRLIETQRAPVRLYGHKLHVSLQTSTSMDGQLIQGMRFNGHHLHA